MLLLCPSPEEKLEKNGKSFVIMEIERPLEISENFVIDPYIIAVVETNSHSQRARAIGVDDISNQNKVHVKIGNGIVSCSAWHYHRKAIIRAAINFLIACS